MGSKTLRNYSWNVNIMIQPQFLLRITNVLKVTAKQQIIIIQNRHVKIKFGISA